MSWRGSGRTVSAILLLLLAACATTPRAPISGAPWAVRLAALQAIDDFSLRGRLAVMSGTEGFSSGVRWVQQGPDASVDLSAPLGFGAAHIESHAGQLAVTTSRGEALRGDAAIAQLKSTLGFDPPLMSLRYWLLGASDPASDYNSSLDDQQRLVDLAQDGWTVQYADYVWTHQQWLPRRVTVQRRGVRLRLVVNDWQL